MFIFAFYYYHYSFIFLYSLEILPYTITESHTSWIYYEDSRSKKEK